MSHLVMFKISSILCFVVLPPCDTDLEPKDNMANLVSSPYLHCIHKRRNREGFSSHFLRRGAEPPPLLPKYNV